jgi:uncharacterized protein YoxC
MSEALQVVLILAAAAFLVLMVVLTQLAVEARKRIASLARSADEVRLRLDDVLRDSNELIRNLNVMTCHLQGELDEVDRLVQTARLWTNRADRLVDEVGSVVEPPVQAVARTNRVLRAGLGAFIKTLFEMKSAGSVTN